MTAVSSVNRSTTAATSAASGRLVVGASGAAVKELQQLLKALGLYPHTVDGKFGPRTEAAVKQFQRAHGLTVDGWAGPQTMAKLRAAAAPKPPATTPAPANGLKLGAKGDAVKEVQTRLKALGLYNGAIGGNFGPGTEAAVKAFQKMKGLAQTGVVDATTLAQLRGGAAPAPVSIGRGATGNSVKEVQMILTALGHYRGAIGGNYGAATEAAVKAFQGKQGLPQTGVVDNATLNALRAANAARTPTTPTTPTPVTGTLQPGQPVQAPSLPPNGTTAPVQPPGLAPVPASASREDKLRAVLNYGIYWANLEQQNPNATTYVGGASSYRYGGVGNGGSAHQGNQSQYRATAGVVGFDCSGLVATMFKQAGISLPAQSSALKKVGTAVPWNGGAAGLQPGDILSKDGHVVVYIGNGQVVEATPFNKKQIGTKNGIPLYEAGGVRISSVSNFPPGDGYVARRVL